MNYRQYSRILLTLVIKFTKSMLVETNHYTLDTSYNMLKNLLFPYFSKLICYCIHTYVIYVSIYNHLLNDLIRYLISQAI